MPETKQAPAVATQTTAEEFSLDQIVSQAGDAVGARSDAAKKEIESQIKVLTEWVLSKSDAVNREDLTGTIAALIAEIDKKLEKQINKIIHHPKFQQLESEWRGLYHLVSNTESEEMLKIKVLNISKKEIGKTFEKFDGSKWDQNPLFKKIYQEEYGTFGGNPFSAFIGAYNFGYEPEDVNFLSGMAKISAAAHAPFIAAAAPSLLGFENWEELATPPDLTKIFEDKKYIPWRTLRASEDARYLALTMPRFVARLPYGPRTTPVEGFHFEEDTSGASSNKYVWANSAYAMGANITRAHKLYGWTTQIRGRESGGKVENLPMHTFTTSDGSTDVKCPTELAITDTREAELSKNGLMALCYVKNTSEAVFVSGQTLQKPKTYEGPGAAEANTNAQLSARLPYIMATCRFAHYLKCMVRDKVGAMMERKELEDYLQQWINNYVLVNPEQHGQEAKARRPLAGAEVEVKEIEGAPGYYNAVFRLRPHFQLEGVNVSLRLVGKLKQGT